MSLSLTHAGVIKPHDGNTYEVADIFGEHTLRVRDRVAMTKTPHYDNVLVRLTDLTLHTLSDDHGYIVLWQVCPR